MFDFSDPRDCERFLMHGLEPPAYKPAIRMFREKLQVMAAKEAVVCTCEEMIRMLSDS